jgi:tRNA G18 (ribose-2'-O)-methylase SpoU
MLHGQIRCIVSKKNDISISGIDFKEPCAIVIGSEEKGIYPALMNIWVKK